nr:PucR family transcriptional regulator ligand-binding domain-containing protein [Patulibacter sp. SYSU D01012]
MLEQHELGLEPLVLPDGAGDRRVSGVHAIETAQPARWLAPDWVMLTTGVRLVGDEAAQAALPAELAAAGVAALGFGVGLDFDAVPAPLLDAAADAGLPVLAVPLRTPFRDVEAAVHRALASSELRTLQRLSSLQRYLVDALHSVEPQRTVVRRLATVLEASVAVLAPDGRVEESAGALPPDGLPALLVDPVRGARDVATGGWRGVATPVAADPDDADDRWLVALAHDRAPSRLTRAVLQAAAPLLAAVGRLDETLRAQDRALRRGLLEDLLAGTGDAQEVAARAAACGVDLHAPVRALVLAPDGAADAGGRERLERRAARTLDGRGARHLLGGHRGRVVVLLAGAGEDPDDALLRELAVDGAAVGVGRTGTGAATVRQSVEDAHVAADLAAADAAVPWRRYADVGLPALLVGEVPPDRMAPQVAAVLGALDRRPGGREAIRAYLDHELDVTAAAAALHLHPNSLRYRLSRLADALGSSLRDPTTIATLVLAFEAERRAGHGRPRA